MGCKIMTGKGSKAKGSKFEYQVRDYFRSLGDNWKADRVPSSGAAQGFPGDVKVIAPDGSGFLVECKSRKDSFNSIYEIVEGRSQIPIKYTFANRQVTIATSWDLLQQAYTHFVPETVIMMDIKIRTLNKINKMYDWVKGSDYLIIKDNHKPMLFLRFQ